MSMLQRMGGYVAVGLLMYAAGAAAMRHGTPARLDGARAVAQAAIGLYASSLDSPTDPQIAQIVLSANSGDSARGVLAEQKGTSAAVKGFGRLMVVSHGGLNKQTVALADSLHVTPEPSAADSDLVSKVQAMTATIEAKTGADFDSTYIDQEVAIHQLVLTDLDNTLIPAARNARLKGLLRSARTVVVTHLTRARQIQRTLR